MSPLTALEEDIRERNISIPPTEWDAIRKQLYEVVFSAKEFILSQKSIADRWFFVSNGVVASEQVSSEGHASIARFFEGGQFCTNLTSVWSGRIASDDLIAITDVEGVFVSDSVFKALYLGSGAFSLYLREKAMETLLFDKDIICAKTSIDTEVRYRFLEERHTCVVDQTPQKDIARFLGITPQGLSRFLRNRPSQT